MDIIKMRNREWGTGNVERGTSTVNKKVKNENKTEKGLLNNPVILAWKNRQHLATPPLVPRDMSEVALRNVGCFLDGLLQYRLTL